MKERELPSSGKERKAPEFAPYRPQNRIRVVTATSLFDGHDVAINIFRRILQDTGVEVIHLGHNRSVEEIVDAAIEEDVQGIAVSSYQGGHVEFFTYLVDLLRERKATHIRVFGGGGGVILPDEAGSLENYGVTRIYTPDHGVRWGLQGIVNDMVQSLDFPLPDPDPGIVTDLSTHNVQAIARLITAADLARRGNTSYAALRDLVREKGMNRRMPILGITGTGGAGKSSLIDEIAVRLLHDFRDIRIAILCSDPLKTSGGALLGDRIRMNAVYGPRVYLRSFAADHGNSDYAAALADAIEIVRAAGFDLAIAETAGVGQGSASIAEVADLSIYVMTSEFGSASQLEKIAMLDVADAVVINKFDKEGSDDALRDVRKQVQRTRRAFDRSPDDMPVFGTIASRFNDDGVTALYHFLLDCFNRKAGTSYVSKLPPSRQRHSSTKTIIIPPPRVRYLAEIADTIRAYHRGTEEQAAAVRGLWHLQEAAASLKAEGRESPQIEISISEARQRIDPETTRLLDEWERIREDYCGDELEYAVRDRAVSVPLCSESLAHQKIPKVALPRFVDPGEIYRWMREENVPGRFPYTAGVYPFKRMDEDPTRMFAGEGNPERTNRRFKLLAAGFESVRLSTAFDSVTLYGRDPDTKPDIYGKIGTSGVSVCTLDDMKVLYDGFDLCAPNTSVSMTINGPAPIILAMFFNTAVDQQADRFQAVNKRKPTPEEYERIRAGVLQNIRGTVQADILKEDQGQNTCLFAIDFALKMMGDIQQFFIDHDVQNFYSVSVSGYHIAEAGANPITQLALTLANGFTYVEYYLSRGMPIDRFAPNLSFFFSNGMDPEYTVIGRVARRIWAIAMRDRYKASPRSQMLKYHIQTSGRSLHSREIQFNDIRTTLQALCAVYDNCNSLHTNAYDEAITTPSRESVRRALAIQQIINREWGLAKCENPNQGSFIVEELTRLVEEAVLAEFDRIAERGGVLGAMEKGYQRSLIQEESLYYEELKHSGALPIVGVNTFINGEDNDGEAARVEVARATEEEKRSQLTRLEDFHRRHREESPMALEKLKDTALKGENIFAELMQTVRVCSLGQITNALFEVGGRYRRNM